MQRRRWLVIVAAAVVLTVVIVSTSIGNANRARLGDRIDMNNLPQRIGQWQGTQIEIAATIITVAQDRGIPTRGQEIGVMVAMGESSLRNLDEGDEAVNPDGTKNCSLGVFQQQWCIGWGTRDQVLDPAYAAGAFFDDMVLVDGWEHRPPGEVGHLVQVNEDEHHYTPYFSDAQLVVSKLTGVKPVN